MLFGMASRLEKLSREQRTELGLPQSMVPSLAPRAPPPLFTQTCWGPPGTLPTTVTPNPTRFFLSYSQLSSCPHRSSSPSTPKHGLPVDTEGRPPCAQFVASHFLSLITIHCSVLSNQPPCSHLPPPKTSTVSKQLGSQEVAPQPM